MKKITSLFLLALMVLTASPAVFAREAGENFLRPLNVQNAYIDTESDNKYELRVNFDWFRTSQGIGGRRVRTNSFNLPRLEVRRSFDTAIPTRIGLSGSINAGETNSGSFGFGNLGITLEAALVNNEEFASTIYFNQHIPWVHNPNLTNSLWRPTNGTDAYSFQTGLQTQFDLGDNLTVYSDLGYRYDDFDDDVVGHSFVYSTEAVLDTGSPINLSMGMLGMTTYDNKTFSSRGARIGGTDIRLVPGLIIPVGEEKNTQIRFGFPIGVSNDAPDFGVQASVFAAI
ncbi:MAG: hypothetical protein HRT47_08385 [Candidatus Caenarcaniphilales bacterium]|nr:hypothetical protein [Candidatus Caenarcaniphilales bacterium]